MNLYFTYILIIYTVINIDNLLLLRSKHTNFVLVEIAIIIVPRGIFHFGFSVINIVFIIFFIFHFSFLFFIFKHRNKHNFSFLFYTNKQQHTTQLLHHYSPNDECIFISKTLINSVY